jgi:mRNA degradation ribonuclease J1/J2
MANGEHKSLSITASDTVIISATPVPGILSIAILLIKSIYQFVSYSSSYRA